MPEGTAEWGLRDVSFRYGPVLALDGVSIRVAASSMSAVVGGDGAGKTTLLRCVAGVLRPARGEVHRPGTRGIGYLSPGGGIYPDLTVDENLAFRAAAYRLPPWQARDRAAEHLDRTGLAAVRGRLAGNLSGGMRRKLGVIAAMLHAPALLVLDEPTTGVDPVSRADLWWLIGNAAADGTAVLLSTTYLDEAQRAGHVVVLDAGRELASGTPAGIIASVPGTIRTLAVRPTDEGERRRSWRRGGKWRVWDPPAAAGETSPGGGGPVLGEGGAGLWPDRTGGPLRPDLQDAVVVAALARELGRETAATGGGRR
jgi:ABC-2 type transport system ATP-binding protein